MTFFKKWPLFGNDSFDILTWLELGEKAHEILSHGDDVMVLFGAKKWPALHSLLKNAQFRAQIRLTSIY